MSDKKITSAFILAAGFGTRLKPYTKELPKALVLYNGKPMIENVISKLKIIGITEFYINTHHFAEKMNNYFLKRKSNESITLIHEKEILGTGGALKNAEEYLNKHQNFIIYNTDVDCDADMNEFYKFHKNSNSIATLCVQDRITNRYLLCSKNGILVGRTEDNEEKIYSESVNEENSRKMAFCGIHIVNSRIFNNLRVAPEKFEIIPFYMNMLKLGEKISIFDITKNRWKDLGIPENL